MCDPVHVTGHDAPSKKGAKGHPKNGRPKQGQLALFKCSRQTKALAMSLANQARESELLAREPIQSMSTGSSVRQCRHQLHSRLGTAKPADLWETRRPVVFSAQGSRIRLLPYPRILDSIFPCVLDFPRNWRIPAGEPHLQGSRRAPVKRPPG